MLLIHSNLCIGGIETFYMRLAKFRHQEGLATKILLTGKKKRNDEDLLKEVRKYAEVWFLEDVISKFSFGFLSFHWLLVKSLDKVKVEKLFDNVDHVHISSSIFGLFFLRMSNLIKLKIPISIGVYHSKEFIWTPEGNLPFYELCNRVIFEKMLENNSVVFFNDSLKDLYSKYYNKNYVYESNVFPLGVIENNSVISLSDSKSKRFRVISIGRLVKFKTYNLWMLDVVQSLRDELDIEYIIYGDGPMRSVIEEGIKNKKIEENVVLKGAIQYSQMSSVLNTADLFVGSGTSIIEASNLGIPSIPGIESSNDAMSYGFVCDLPGFSYNEDGLYKKYSVQQLIRDYASNGEVEKKEIQKRHAIWAQKFSMSACVNNFEKLKENALFSSASDVDCNGFLGLRYSLSFFIYSLKCRLRGKNLNEIVYG